MTLVLQRLLPGALGVGLIALVIWLGLETRSDTSLVVWFGLAAAILAPLGLALIGYALGGRQRRTIDRLSQVPEIERLVARAETEQERLAALEEERRSLEQIIRFEASRQALLTERERLEEEAERILATLHAVDAELNTLGEVPEPLRAEVEMLREAIAARGRGDLILSIRGRRLILPRQMFTDVPGPAKFLAAPLLIALDAISRSKSDEP